MALDFSFIPDNLELDARSGQLVEAYLDTWRRVMNRPAALIEYLRHLHVRAVLGFDAPSDRQAMALVNLTVLEYLRDFTSNDPAARRQARPLFERRELFLKIARGERVSIDLDEHGAWGSLEIESGDVRVAFSRPLELDRATWTVQVGHQGKAARPGEDYKGVGVVSSIRLVDAAQQLMGGQLSWREFAADWLAIWQRQMARVLLEPLVPGSLRKFTAGAAHISLTMLQNIGKEHDDHTADDILPSAQCRKIWGDVMENIVEGGLVLAALTRDERLIVALHFEGRESYASGDEAPAVSVHPDLPETFRRVSEATLVSEEVQASIRAATVRKDPIVKDAQRAKIGRNEPCPCGSGRKYKKCCWLK